MFSVPDLLAGLLIGTILGLFVEKWFVGLLPGPKIVVFVSGIRVVGTNVSNGILYQFTFTATHLVDDVYIRVQLPTHINSINVGRPCEAMVAAPDGNLAPASLQGWVIETNPNGEWIVVSAAVNNDAEIQASASGNMFAMHSEKLRKDSSISGMVTTNEGRSSVTPAPAIFMEGEYEYSMLGQTVRKPVRFSYKGISDLK